MASPRSDEFVPFVPRRIARAPSLDAPLQADVAAVEAGVAANAAARADADASTRADDDVDQPSSAPMGCQCDRPTDDTAVRVLAIRLAGIACARALHEAIARNPLFVARFVDDALLAFGDAAGARVRLRPGEAASCAAAVSCDVVADDTLAPGEVMVESDCGVLRASIEARAERLVRAAADA